MLRKITSFTILIALLAALVLPTSAAVSLKTKAVPVAAKTANVPTLAVPSLCGALRVKGTHLTDQSGTPVQLRGVSTHGLAWYPAYVNEDCFRQLRQEWHANAVRLALYTEEYGGYCSGGDRAALNALIDKGIACAAAQDLYVIVDWHILSDGDPNRHLDDAKQFFSDLSARYAGCPNILYEICNEPNGGVTWPAIKRYAEAVIPAIRAHDKDSVILVGTPNWSQFVDQAAADPITGYDNIMYTLHFYAATHTDALRNTMTAALAKGLPMFVSEFGICDASGNGAINEPQANAWINLLDRNQISYIAWNLSNKAETSALIRSDCQKTSNFKPEDLSVSGQWLRKTLTRRPEQIPTVIPGTVPAPVPAPTPPPAPSTSAAPAHSASTVSLQNQWPSNGGTCYQYALTVHNPAAAPCSSWEVTVTFSTPVTLQDSWNGNYTVSGNTLRITSKDYNGAISAGGTLEGVGFIVKGGAELKVVSCT